MSYRAVEHLFTGTTTPYTSYDSTKTTLGKWIAQYAATTSEPAYAGPRKTIATRPSEWSPGVALYLPHVIDVGNNIHWIFSIENTSAGSSRRVFLHTFNTSTEDLQMRGFVTCSIPPGGTQTARGLRVVRYLYTTGTVTVSGTAVTGSSTAWQTSRYAVGSRIGFGSTDPNAITTWYYISAIGSDTSITLTASAGTIGAGTAFVIEELRIYMGTTNGSSSNAGMMLAKGVNYDDFIVFGTTIAAAGATDNVKGTYYLTENASPNTVGVFGMDISASYSDTSHFGYTFDRTNTTTFKIWVFDLRASLSSLSTGISISAFLYGTGNITIPASDNITAGQGLVLRATTNHGPGAGVSSFYISTSAGIARVVESAITSNATNLIADYMKELPYGTLNTYNNSGMRYMTYMDGPDYFMASVQSGQRSYMFRYQTDIKPMERVSGFQTGQLDGNTADPRSPLFPANITSGTSPTWWCQGDICYILRVNTSSAWNQMFVYYPSVDWDFAALAIKRRLITPELSTAGCRQFRRLGIQHASTYGHATFAINPMPLRAYYRTAGISDDSGSWTAIDQSGDISGANPSNSIQFMFEFQMFGASMMPAKIYGITCTYQDAVNDGHFNLSFKHSSLSPATFAWRVDAPFGGTVPSLSVKISDAVTGAVLIEDTTTSSAYGTFEKTTDDGQSWGSYNSTDVSNTTTLIRYTPTAFPAAARVVPLLKTTYV
jgi:hypothetical protein